MTNILTVFTPTYNRAHTLSRLYESLCRQTVSDFEWLVVDDGSTDSTRSLIEGFINERRIPIRYIFKENGGLHTAYNAAYENIDSELCVCIDSDDYMPENAVELILNKWKREGCDSYCGIVGLDFDEVANQPIAGFFPEELKHCYYLDLYQKKIHRGDAKYVMRSELMKKVAPQVGFTGEKFFNPTYMFMQIGDDYPLLVLNENLCYIGIDNDDRMSTDIYHQYRQSPRSFAKLRELEMSLKRSTGKNRFRSAIHYVAESLLAKNKKFIIDSANKGIVLLSLLPGIVLYYYINMRK